MIVRFLSAQSNPEAVQLFNWFHYSEVILEVLDQALLFNVFFVVEIMEKFSFFQSILSLKHVWVLRARAIPENR